MTALHQGCDAGVVFAVEIEADAFERLACHRTTTRAAGLVVHEGTMAGARVAWCVGGTGTVAAARAARLLASGHRPRLFVAAGFAGGLDPAVPRGAVVRPALSVAEGAPRPLPLHAPRSGSGAGPTIVTVADVVATSAAKRALAARSGAQLVDMETHAVAGVAAEAGLPCAAIRVISDAADEDLPREIAALARPQSAMRRLGAALGAVGRRPRAALDLWRLYEHAVVDARTLAAALADLCADATRR
jgi:adenosylhomocysteine nucleosidase